MIEKNSQNYESPVSWMILVESEQPIMVSSVENIGPREEDMAW